MSARLHQTRGRSEDAGLFARHLADRFGRLTPFEIGIAAQGAETRARRIDEYPVDLAGQPLDLEVVLVGDDDREHIRQTAARETRAKTFEPFGAHVEGIQAAGVAHQCAEREGLAAGTGAKIDHHFAAPGRDQLREQLRAFVLHLERAGLEQRMPVDRRLVHQAHAIGRIRRGRSLEHRPTFNELREHRRAIGLEPVHAQVERGRAIERTRQLHCFVFAELRDQPRPQPFGQIALHGERHRAAIDLARMRKPFEFGRRRGRARIDFEIGQAQQQQAACDRPAARLRKLRIDRALAQSAVGPFGHQGAHRGTQRLVFAEIS